MTTTRAWLFMDVQAAAPGCAPEAQAPTGTPDSTLHPRARRVIERPHRDPGGNALRSDLHLVLPRGDPLGADRHAAVGDVAETQGSTESMAEHSGGDPSDEFTVPPDRLVVIQQPIRALEGDRHESAPDAGFALAHERLESDEAAGLVPGDGKLQASLKRRGLVADVVAPVPVSLLHAQAVQGMVAREAQAKGRAGADDHVVH